MSRLGDAPRGVSTMGGIRRREAASFTNFFKPGPVRCYRYPRTALRYALKRNEDEPICDKDSLLLLPYSPPCLGEGWMCYMSSLSGRPSSGRRAAKEKIRVTSSIICDETTSMRDEHSLIRAK